MTDADKKWECSHMVPVDCSMKDVMTINRKFAAYCKELRGLMEKIISLNTPHEFKDGNHLMKRHQAMASFARIGLNKCPEDYHD